MLSKPRSRVLPLSSEIDVEEKSRSNEAIAQALISGVERGDIEGVLSLYHDDAVVWRNFDRRTLSREQFAKVVRFLVGAVDELRYEDIVLQATATGFVQQHRLCGVAANGEAIDVAACMVATCHHGRIQRLDEYLDSGELAALMG